MSDEGKGAKVRNKGLFFLPQRLNREIERERELNHIFFFLSF